MKKKKLIINIALVALLIFAVAAFYVYKEYNRSHKDTSELPPDYSIAALDLLSEFETGESSAGKKYWDKVILVDGMVKAVTVDERGVYSVVLGDTSSMSSVRCNLDSTHNKEAADVKKGNHVAVKGICTGFNADELLGSDVILVRCVLHSSK
ncbi:OB-fold protein [Terrimonas alba]|uniref:OB-fold protein n=1 Tax=Terrimonas alba TaxID=3349636 RepID=UPI0035F3619B